MAETRFFIVGGAGFIGSHLADRLVERGRVTVFDNLSVGRQAYLAGAIVEADASDLPALERAMAGHDAVFHLAANPEARHGLANPRLDLEQGTLATWNALEAARRCAVPRFVLASSGTVYGDTANACDEGALGALPISLYGASKLAGEALLSAFTACFGLRGWIFRFGNVVGPRGTHGAALDFLRKLAARPDALEVLGDGRQSKPYVHVEDCVDAVLFGFDHAADPLNVFNIAPDEVTTVARLAALCIAASPYPGTAIRYTGGDRGWPGDVPRSRLDPSRLAALGWRVLHSSDEAARRAVDALAREVFGAPVPPAEAP